ncbi:MAG TPA: tetratricopeptide repeat protein [Desulfuromonadales bacterium]|nr:tetratricopeptide repeat protein [Desulfuromonadales bacterium]
MAFDANTRIVLAKVAEYVEELTRDPGSRVFVPLSEIYRQAGMFQAAQSILLKGIKQNPDYGPGYIALGRTLASRDMAGKAEKAFRKALEVAPGNLPALKALLRIFWEKGDVTEARKTAEALYKVKPGDEDAEKILQRIAERHEKETAPGASGEQVAAPKKSKAEEPIKTATLAEIYVRQGLFEKALNVYRQVLSRDPQNQEIRQKALAVKKRLEEQRAQERQKTSTEALSTPSEEEFRAADEAVSSVQERSAMNESAPERLEEAPTEDAPIRIFQGWLDSIRQRRSHVQ